MTARARLMNRISTVRQRRRTFPFAFGGNVDSIDDATEVYGEPIDPNTLPFDPDLLCDHVPASCLRSRVCRCETCGEIL